MSADKVKKLLVAAFPDSEISVTLDGANCSVSVVSDRFFGLRPVARQQAVYQPLMGLIADGTLHAINIDARTPGASDR